MEFESAIVLIGDEETTPVTVRTTGGHFTPAKFSGSPDSWEPEDSEAPELEAVWITGEAREINLLCTLTDEQVRQLTDEACDRLRRRPPDSDYVD